MDIDIKLMYPSDKLLYKNMLNKMLNGKLNVNDFKCNFVSSFKIGDKTSDIRKILAKQYKNAIDKIYFKLFLPFKTENDKRVSYKELKTSKINKHNSKIYYKICYFPQLFKITEIV